MDRKDFLICLSGGLVAACSLPIWMPSLLPFTTLCGTAPLGPRVPGESFQPFGIDVSGRFYFTRRLIASSDDTWRTGRYRLETDAEMSERIGLLIGHNGVTSTVVEPLRGA